ncbi:hypothetical protein Tco_0089411 [Tanacetum coccineum]
MDDKDDALMLTTSCGFKIRVANLNSVVRRKEEVKEQGKEEDEMETDEEIEEVFEDKESVMEIEEEWR